VSRRAVVEELAALGAAVHNCSRKEAELGERLEEWDAKGFRVTVSVCDLSVRDQRERLVRDVGDRFGGKLNILVIRFLHSSSSSANAVSISVDKIQWCLQSFSYPVVDPGWNWDLSCGIKLLPREFLAMLRPL
jgi:NAD(P)-dependent dehydrogenase (short-subunit alcohol dehydrogenase family)